MMPTAVALVPPITCVHVFELDALALIWRCVFCPATMLDEVGPQ